MTAGASVDVAIVGGGPAGCAAALALRRHAPFLSVALIEASDYERPRVGEILPALANPILDWLGIGEAVRGKAFRPAPALMAAWGGSGPVETHALFSARGHGWHLDRRRFDAALAASAAERGVDVRLSSPLAGVSGGPDNWTLALENGRSLGCRLLIEASGRSRAVLRHLAPAARPADRLVAYVRFFAEPQAGDPRTLIEARPEGWWYSAVLPEGNRVIACMTDADLGRAAGFARIGPWREALAATACMPEVDCGNEAGALVRAAGTSFASRSCGPGWIAAGDAAATFDPLSAHGMVKALRGGIFAAYAAADCLAGREESAFGRYRCYMAAERAAYRDGFLRHYADETRWPEFPFWRRRRPDSWREAC